MNETLVRRSGRRVVLLLGDSIRLRYEPHVLEALRDVADVTAPKENCESSERLRMRLGEWIAEARPDVVHLNCGLHDIRYDPGRDVPQVALSEYEENLEFIFGTLEAEGIEKVVSASTTPIDEKRHVLRSSRRFEDDVVRYNAAAAIIASRFGAACNDLFAAVQQAGPQDLLGEDGVHFTEDGYAFLADRVASFLRSRIVSPVSPGDDAGSA